MFSTDRLWIETVDTSIVYESFSPRCQWPKSSDNTEKLPSQHKPFKMGAMKCVSRPYLGKEECARSTLSIVFIHQKKDIQNVLRRRSRSTIGNISASLTSEQVWWRKLPSNSIETLIKIWFKLLRTNEIKLSKDKKPKKETQLSRIFPILFQIMRLNANTHATVQTKETPFD